MAYRIDRFRFWFAAFFAVTLSAWPSAAMPFLAAIPFATILATSLIGAALSFGLSFVAKALMTPASQKAATVDASANASDSKITLKQPIAPRRIIYGETRVSGIFAFLGVKDGNQNLIGVIMWAGHFVEQIVKIWIDDTPQDLDGSGFVTNGKYAGNAQFTTANRGSDDQPADGIANGNMPTVWTENHRLRGIANSGFRLRWDNTTGTGNPSAGTFQVLQLGAKLWTGGIPNITAVIRGRHVYDPRTGTVGYSTNSALCVADYLCDKLYGYGIDYETGINEEALIAAANACDEDVDLKAGGVQKRYTTNGTFTCDEPRDQLLARLLGAMQGRAVYDGDRWTIFAGVWLPASETLTDDDMRAPSTIATMQSAADAFNGVKGVHNSPDNKYQPADFPAIQSDALRGLDGGEEAWNDIELPFTDNPAMAQRIAKIQLLDARQEIREVFRGKLSCWRVLGGTTIKRTSARYAWPEKLFTVEQVSLVFETDESGNPVVGCDVHLKETAPEIWDWETDEESLVDVAPNSEFPDIFNVLPVQNLRVTEYQFVALNGAGVQAAFRLDWDQTADAMSRTGGYYRGRYRMIGETLWTSIPDTNFISMKVEGVAAGDYEAEVEAVNWAGNASPSVHIDFTVVGLSAKPATPQGFTVAANDSIGYARWTPLDDLDVNVGGYYVLKHSELSPGATWEQALSMGEDIPGSTNVVIVPLVSGTYLLKARDSTGNYSVTPATFVQFQSSVHTFDLVSGGSSVQDPGFAGVRTDVVVDGGSLRLDSDGDFDSAVDVDALAAWDFFGGLLAAGSYKYDAVMELGEVKNVRLTNIVSSGIINVFDNFDERESDVDSWDSWDGAGTGVEADSWLMVEWTLDDPGPGRQWFGPQRLHSSTFAMKAARFTRELRSYDPSFTVAISADAVYAEEVVI